MNDEGRASESQNVIPLRVDVWDGSPFEMTMDRILRIKMRMAELQMDQAALSNATGLSNSAISQILTQKIRRTRHLPAIAKALAVNMSWLLTETDQRVDLTTAQGDDMTGGKVDTVKTEGILAQQFERKWDAVTVAEIDLTNSAVTAIKGIPVKPNGHIFSREVLRTFTNADGAAVMVAQGIGNAMQPLLNDGDLVFFDTSHQTLDCLDAVWLMRYAGLITVRRARKTPEGIRLMADNALLPDILAADGEVEFLGKLAGLARKV